MHETACDEQAQDREQNMALMWTCRMKQRAKVNSRMKQRTKVNKLVTLLYIILDVSPGRCSTDHRRAYFSYRLSERVN
jgi:hypothetical protein